MLKKREIKITLQIGTTLLFSLIYLLLLSWLSGSILELSLLSNKTNYHYYLRLEDFAVAEIALRQIENKLLHHKISHCILSQNFRQDFNPYVLSSWQHAPCSYSYDHHSIKFYIEHLDFQPSAFPIKSQSLPRISNPPIHDRGADFYRITLMSSKNNKRIRILQSTMVLFRQSDKMECISPMLTLSPGRQSWREIEY